MTNSPGRGEIEALLAERGRFEQWLEQLSAKAATMPPHVVERVRADYQQRLDKVMGGLLSQADALRSEASVLDERVRSLASELAAKQDARAEDELRALVGEYDEDAWAKKAADHDAGIQAVERERAERDAEHSRIRQLLEESVRPARPATPASSPAVALPAAAETKTVAEPTPAVNTTAAGATPEPQVQPPAAEAVSQEREKDMAQAPPAPKRPSPFDEIGFMRAVVGRTTPFGGVALTPEDLPPVEPRANAPAAAPAPENPPAPSPPAPAEAPVNVSAERKAVPAFEAPPIPDAPIVAPVRASSPAIPMIADESSMVDSMRSSTTMPDAARTLKCQECGWMNYPTEWYCEKCGGELAAF